MSHDRDDNDEERGLITFDDDAVLLQHGADSRLRLFDVRRENQSARARVRTL